MIKRAALIGLGTMGPGIAARLARGGLEVRAYDVQGTGIARSIGVAVAHFTNARGTASHAG
jgi:5-formyl-3-hydroxy-2-methylpyridine 4-carboxylic acid 5-dehydrogenase